MGRAADPTLSVDVPRSVRLFRVNLDSGGYDDGGAYWGFGGTLWCAMDDDGSRQFVRAGSRESAAFALDIPPNALKVACDATRYGLALLDNRAPMPQGKKRDDVIEWMRAAGAAI
jgi:hypothetical protein